LSQSSELSGGAGFTYEDEVATYYLAMLLAQSEASGIPNNFVVTRVALQQSNFGEPLDDIIVDGGTDNNMARLSLQTKRSVQISSALSNTDFRDIVTKSWLTRSKNNFRIDHDRFGFVVHDIKAADMRNLDRLCGLARNHGPEQFAQAFDVGGIASKDLRAIKEIITTLLTESFRAPTLEELHDFLRHFLCIRIDFPGETSTTISAVNGALQNVLLPEDRDKASLLRSVLRNIARDGAGYSAEFDRASLLLQLSNQFRFVTNKRIENAKQQELNASTNTVYPQILAMPFGPEFDRRRAWPENLLMRIGVDRTRLLGVVADIEAQVLFEALRYTEELVAASDSRGQFGRRRWFCVESDWPRLDDETTAIGVVWNIPNDLSMDQIRDAILTCWSGSMESTDDQQFVAGNVLVAVVNDEDKQYAEELRCHLVKQAKALGVTNSACGWSLGQAAQLAKAVSDPIASELRPSKAFLVDFEWDIVRACYDSQKSFLRCERAVEQLRRLSSELENKWQPLCNWVCGDITAEKIFFAQADYEVYQLARLAGLLTGDGYKLTKTQAERGAEIVRTVVNRPELSSILGSLPVCSQVLDTLCSCKATCRAAIGLVTSKELHRAVKPWVGQPIDDWRHGRLLVF
jgi:hypothetical protein